MDKSKLTLALAIVMLLVPFGKYFNRVLHSKDRILKHEPDNRNEFDMSLRNYHPNKGE